MGEGMKTRSKLALASAALHLDPPFRDEKRKDQYSRAVIYAVYGFWSGDNVRVSQSRDYREGKWEAPQINWSCGGREPAKEPDDIVAVGCFAKAMTAAVKVARKWQKDND